MEERVGDEVRSTSLAWKPDPYKRVRAFSKLQTPMLTESGASDPVPS
jgi:hypothetical protein